MRSAWLGARRVLAVTAGLALAAGALHAAEAQALPAAASTTADCDLPRSVPLQHATVTVLADADLPATATAGNGLAPTGLTLTVILPADLVAALRTGHVAALDGSVSATVTVRSRSGTWEFPLPDAPLAHSTLPDDGEARIAATAATPALPLDDPGAVTVGLTGVRPTLRTHGGGVDAMFSDTVGCTPGAPADLATISVTAPRAPGLPGSPGDPADPADPGEPANPGGPATPGGSTGPGLPPAVQRALGALTGSRAGSGIAASYYVDDTTTHVRKLGSDLTIGRGQFDASVAVSLPPSALTGSLTLPPAAGYFVSFRFVPVTSRMTVTEVGQAEGTANLLGSPLHADATVHLRLDIALSGTRVNGVPLDVGPRCHTATPAAVTLHGVLGLTPGSPATTVRTSFTIPPFTGCGGTEDLDPLLTGLVSGPDNDLSSTLSVRCIAGVGCPPS